MKITKELLLQEGFEEHNIEGQMVFVRGRIALVYVFSVWIPCYYSAGTVLSSKLYINTMEELEIINKV